MEASGALVWVYVGLETTRNRCRVVLGSCKSGYLCQDETCLGTSSLQPLFCTYFCNFGGYVGVRFRPRCSRTGVVEVSEAAAFPRRAQHASTRQPEGSPEKEYERETFENPVSPRVSGYRGGGVWVESWNILCKRIGIRNINYVCCLTNKPET